MPKCKVISSDEESGGDSAEPESEEEVQATEAPKLKHLSKPTTKRHAIEKENIDVKIKQVEWLQKEIKSMAHMQKTAPQEVDDHDLQKDVKSEDEDIQTSRFSSSIRALATVAIPNAWTKTPIRHVGAAAARVPPKDAAEDDGVVPEPRSDDSGLRPSSPLDRMNRNLTSGETLERPAMKEPAFRKATEYEALVSTKNAFPNTALHIKWAKQSWKNAGLDAGEAYKMTDGIGHLIRNRGSRICGFALGRIRLLLVTILRFKTSTSARTITYNQDLYQKLRANSCFHYKDPETWHGFAQGKIVSESVCIVWFEDKRSHGVVYEKLFNPVPLETFALIFTILNFCLEEFSTGKCVKAKIWEKDVLVRHKKYQTDLQNWQELNPTAVKGIRKKYYLHASRNADVIDETTIEQTLISAAKDQACNELEGRTRETDSEAEGA